MGIYRRKHPNGKRSKYYHVEFQYRGVRIAESSKKTTKEAAKRFAYELKDAIDAKFDTEHCAPKVKKKYDKKRIERWKQRYEHLTLSEAIDIAYEERWKSRSDGKRTLYQLRHCLTIIGDIPIESIDKFTMQALKNTLSKQDINPKTKSRPKSSWPKGQQPRYRKPATINRYLAAMKTLLMMAHKRWDAIKKVPFIDITPEPFGRLRTFSQDEESQLLHLIRNRKPKFSKDYSQYYIGVAELAEVLLYTGMRLGEALRITYDENIDLQRDVIHLHPEITKSGKPRSIPILSNVKEILIRRKPSYPQNPFPYELAYISKVFRWARTQMGIPDDKQFVPHACRHTFASRLVQNGVSLYKVQRILGHSSPAVTQRYAHMQVENLRESMQTLRSENNEKNRAEIRHGNRERILRIAR